MATGAAADGGDGEPPAAARVLAGSRGAAGPTRRAAALPMRSPPLPQITRPTGHRQQRPAIPIAKGRNVTEPTSTIMDITPTIATKWLAQSNTHNRALREGKVSAYARDMINGAWLFNGDAIRFAADGTLLDGQHRLAAVARSGVTIRSIVVHGLPRAAQDTVDIGAHRALRDQLQLHGEPHARELAAVARRALLAYHGTVAGSSFTPTHAEVTDFIAHHPGVRRAAEVAVYARGKLPVAPTALATAFFVCAEINASDAEAFYTDQVIDGLGLFHQDLAWVLRQRYQREAATGRQMPSDDVYRYAVLAWNYFRAGAQISKLQAPKGGWAAAPLPQPK